MDSSNSQRDPELTTTAKRAINRYLWILTLKFAAFFGIVNILVLWTAYETVVTKATKAASDAAITKVNALKEPFELLSETMIKSAAEALESVGHAKNEIQDIKADINRIANEAMQVDSFVKEVASRLNKYEEEVLAKKQITIQKIDAHYAQLSIDIKKLPPQIDIIQPEIEHGEILRLPAGTNEQLIIGKVRSASSLRIFTVNDREVEIQEDGHFETNVRISPKGTKVKIFAVSNEGKDSSTIFTLQSKLIEYSTTSEQVGLIVAQLPGCSSKTTGDCDNVWSNQRQHALTYCVSTDFNDRYNEVVQDIKAATEAWESAAKIDFIHKKPQDNNCGPLNNNVLFDIRPIDASGIYLARSFFPNEPRSRRSILIDDSAFSLDPKGNLQLVGILRHELGKALGFRNEHTRPESGVCYEDDEWRPLSESGYNPYSVMHYPQCNGLGDWSLTLTQSDKNGAACLYGPAEGFVIDPKLCEM